MGGERLKTAERSKDEEKSLDVIWLEKTEGGRKGLGIGNMKITPKERFCLARM